MTEDLIEQQDDRQESDELRGIEQHCPLQVNGSHASAWRFPATALDVGRGA
jgi:hypothetical protein